jgi:hypothetical protein
LFFKPPIRERNGCRSTGSQINLSSARDALRMQKKSQTMTELRLRTRRAQIFPTRIEAIRERASHITKRASLFDFRKFTISSKVSVSSDIIARYLASTVAASLKRRAMLRSAER